MSTNGKVLSVRNIDPSLWHHIRVVSVQKGSPVAYCLNTALRDYLVKHGSISA